MRVLIVSLALLASLSAVAEARTSCSWIGRNWVCR